jgi:pescadillo
MTVDVSGDEDDVVEDDEAEPIEVEASLAMDQPQIERKVPQTESEELHELSALMMSKKAKRLYGRMQHGISKKRGEIDRLKAKRKAVEANYTDTGIAVKKSKKSKAKQN